MDTICFTGHRDRITSVDALESMYESWFNALWLQGGAQGFDAQVREFCKIHTINHQMIEPDYKRYAPTVAPLVRNKWMVDRSRLVVACWDGRTRGGTFQTVNYAKMRGVSVVVVPAMRIPEAVL